MFRSQGQYTDNAKNQQIFQHRRIEVIAQYLNLLCSDHTRRRVVGEPTYLGQRPHDEELRGQGGCREIKTTHAQGRQAEHDTDSGGAHPAQNKRHQNRHTWHAQYEIIGTEGTHCHECSRAKRYLTGVTGQNILAQRRQRENQERHQDGR